MSKRKHKSENDLEFSNRCLYRAFQMVRYIPVIKRLYPSLLKQWARLTWTGGYKVKLYKGCYLLLNYKNSLDRKIGLHGGHEMEQFSFFFAHMRRGCHIFVDIGANIGTYSLQAARLGGVKEIHAFEPDPRNYAQLQGNIYLNKFTDVIRTHPFALSDKSGMLSFELGTDQKPDLTRVATGADGTKQLMAKTLDEVLAHYRGRKIFLKIDAEGHEREVLRGATELLKYNACFLQIEAWPLNAAMLTQELKEIQYHCIHRIHNDYYFSATQ